MEEFEDGLDVAGGQMLQGAEIDAGDDHRIAMAFAVAGLRASRGRPKFTEPSRSPFHFQVLLDFPGSHHRAIAKPRLHRKAGSK